MWHVMQVMCMRFCGHHTFGHVYFYGLWDWDAAKRAGLHVASRRATVSEALCSGCYSWAITRLSGVLWNRLTHAPFGAPTVGALGGAGGGTAYRFGLVVGVHLLPTTPALGLMLRAGARDPNPALGVEGRLGLRTFPRRPAGLGRPVTQVVHADRQGWAPWRLGLTLSGLHRTPRSICRSAGQIEAKLDSPTG